MSYEKRMNEQQWQRVYEYLSQFKGIYVRNEETTRQFVEAIFWMSRSGSQWRLLPTTFGNWNKVYKRFADWAKKEVWHTMLYHFSQEPDMEFIMVDSTILRAHACASPQKKSRAKKV